MHRFLRPVRRAALFVGTFAVVFALGCGGEPILGEAVPNTPPDTQVEATPPNLGAASFQIEFFWSGSDRDGEVAYFEWLITDNGGDNVMSPADTVGTWNRTTALDSSFVVSAEIPDFPDDATNDQIDDPRHVRFWQTHTFLVRAVDDDGAADPSPATASFTATTIAPVVAITSPTNPTPGTCLDGPMAPTFRWEASDPDDARDTPLEVRYAFFEWDAETCVTDVSYERLDPIGTLDADDWTPWISTEASADSGRIKTFPVLEGGPGKMYFFAVQARDRAGAVSPLFEFGRNVFHLRTSDTKFPALTVNESSLGTRRAIRTGSTARFDIVPGQPLNFTWAADASSYGSFVEEYRYGFDVLDPADEFDPDWDVPWGPQWQTASRPAGFESGSRRFVVQARDVSGNLSQIVYELQVIPLKARSEQRPLLLIDDSDESESANLDATFDARWNSILFQVDDFLPGNDVIDVVQNRNALDFARAKDYRALIWLVSSDPYTYFASELAPESPQSAKFNWLEVYQEFIGNVMLVGPRAMRSSLDQTQSFDPIFPIVFNVSFGQKDYAAGVGFGTTIDADGRRVNAGTLRYPYTAWCLDAIDMADPLHVGRRDNSQGRTLACDSFTYARVASAYVDRYRPSPAQVGNLEPRDVRRNAGRTRDLSELEFFGQINMQAEEFYNHNAPRRNVQLTLRACQVPMYEAIARMDVDDVDVMQPGDRDEGYHLPVQERLVDTLDGTDDTDERCPAVRLDGRTTSTVTGAPIVIASTQYVDTKQNGTVPFEDYLWGFNPLSFEVAEVRGAIEWIVLNQWNINGE